MPKKKKKYEHKKKHNGSKTRIPQQERFFKPKLKAYVKENPDAYQSEIAEAIGAKENTVCKALHRLKISRKKRHRSTENGTNKDETLISKR